MKILALQSNILNKGVYKMRKYVVKDANNKKYKNVFGVTDYDIPMFGFKSAILLLL